MTTKVQDDLDQLPFDYPDDDALLPGEPVHPAEEAAISAAKRKPRTRKPKEEPVPEEIVVEEKALVRIEPMQTDHHIVTGMAALARMDDAQYEQAIAVVKRGMERVKDFQQRAMTKGEDYGIVKGIERPFLHLPGAEKLTLLYGLAARQEAERIIGMKAVQKVGDIEAQTGEWLSPPLAYHVKTYVHVGSFEGPIVAMGYGEASSWEVKYRYVTEKPLCPRCGTGLHKGGKEGSKFQGKWWCPGFKGGCWWSADIEAKNEDGTLVIPPPGKIENPDPWSLAETLIQMAAKRSFVAATRRATGTSGLFTQDEDSPSVQAQTEDGGDDAPPEVEKVDAGQAVARGGKVEKPTQEQINELGRLSREKDLGPVKVAEIIERVTGAAIDFGNVTDRGAQSALLVAAIQQRTADEIGAVIQAVETGEVPEQTAADVERDDPVAYATYPDDIGAK